MSNTIFVTDFIITILLFSVASFKLSNAITPVADRVGRQLRKRQFDLVLATSIFITVLRRAASSEDMNERAGAMSLVSCIVIMVVDIRDIYRIKNVIKPA